MTRVTGNINGKLLEFTTAENDRWEVSFPANPDGEYVVEISAVDDAGNRGYLCTMLFAVSGHSVRGYVVPRGFSGTAAMCEYSQDAQRRQDSLHSYPAEDMQPYLKILRMLKKSLKGGIHLSVSYIAEVQMDLGEKYI